MSVRTVMRVLVGVVIAASIFASIRNRLAFSSNVS